MRAHEKLVCYAKAFRRKKDLTDQNKRMFSDDDDTPRLPPHSPLPPLPPRHPGRRKDETDQTGKYINELNKA